MSFEELAISLFFIMDPIGVIPIELALLSGFDPKKRRKIVIRECIIALGKMLIFMFFGSRILSALGINTPSAQIGSFVHRRRISLHFFSPATLCAWRIVG